MRSRRLVEVLVTAVGGDGVGYRELATVIRELVLTGQLLVGESLPSERTLSSALGCSRTTVTAALTLLRTEGVLVSRQGSGTVVAATPDEAVVLETGRPADFDRPPAPDLSGVVDLVTAAPPPPAELSDLVHAAAERLVALTAWHGVHEFGLPELRAAIARHLSAQGLPTGPEHVLVTQGVVHGWNLVLRALAGPGTSVGVEQLTQPQLHAAAAAVRTRTVGIGVDGEGWHLPREAPDLVLVTADHHTPTGLDQGDDARRALVRALPASSQLVVDTVLTGLDLRDRPPARPLALLRRDAIVLGSLSKTVWAGLRIGWVRAPVPTVARLAAARATTDYCGPVVEQVLALEVLARHERLLAAMRLRSRARAAHLRATLRRAGWNARIPDGGHRLWLELGSDGSATALARAGRAERVWVTPGPTFSLTGTHDRWVRLAFSRSEAVLDEAVRRLARAADRVGPAAGRSHPRELRQAGEVA